MGEAIFSGLAGEDFWRRLNRVGHTKRGYGKYKKSARRLHDVLYRLACKCQELEAEVARLRGSTEGRV